jgi:hypothetical protein
MKLILSTTLITVALLASASDAEARHHRYVGVHPVADAAGGGTCYIEAPHVHVYAPVDVKVQYRVHDGWHHFVGDPVAHGYEGPRHAYHGAHPIHVDVVVNDPYWEGDHHVEWCYLAGAHYHWYEPGVRDKFVVEGEVYWYVGVYPEEFERGRKVHGRINVVYEPIEYQRPEVVVEPPTGYVDIMVVTPAVVVETPAVEVHTPRPRPARGGVHIEVEVPVPTIEVHAGASIGVGVVGGHRHHKHKKYKKHKKHKKHKKYRKHRGRH